MEITQYLLLEGRRELVIKTPEASADLSDFSRFFQYDWKNKNLVSALFAQGNLHLVILQMQDAAAYSPNIQLLRKTPPCRVLQSFEPAFAGGSSPENFALAQAYRVVYVRQRPIINYVGSKP